MSKIITIPKRPHSVTPDGPNRKPKEKPMPTKGPDRVERAIKEFYNKHGEAMTTLAYE